MKVVLIKNIQGLGRAGDIKEVKDGYANNFLFPRKLAEPASEKKAMEMEAKKSGDEKKKKKAQKNRRKIASKIDGKRFSLNLQSDQTGTLYKKLTAKYISERLGKEGLDISEKNILLDSPIKKTGEYTVFLKIDEVKPKIKIIIN